jgi:exodeoxyribonuclease V alpha subunit
VDDPAEETLEAIVERTVYHDRSTRYTVLRLRVPGNIELVTAVGRSDGVEDDGQVVLRGAWDTHPTHGRQFAFSSLRVRPPTTTLGIERRLMRYPGIREVMARRIVDRFGLETLDILDQRPRRLLEVEGIGKKTLERIVEYHGTLTGPIADIEAKLIELELSPHLARPIHSRYGERSQDMLMQHPYRLGRDVRGIGFLTADRLARALGVSLDSDERVEAGVLHVLERAEADGHCALPLDRLVEAAVEILDVDAERVHAGVDGLRASRHLVVEVREGQAPLCFPQAFAAAEQDVARVLTDLSSTQSEPWTIPRLPGHLSDGQVEAIRAVARAGVVVLTGGPGTGKSTVVRQVLELGRANGADLLLAAPTGRAAKRLEQAAREPARTVHRLLEIQGDTGRFVHGPGNPLPPALVVVDESSMLDLQLAQALLGALTPAHRLLLVGDADQLPSVGPGNVLRDVIAAVSDWAEVVPVVRLSQIFRQAEGSSIVQNAHRVLHGRRPQPDESGRLGEFFVIRATDAERAHDLVLRSVTERIPEAYGLDSRTEIQVLCPMHKGRAGTEALNEALQAHHTEGQPGVDFGPRGRPPRTFRVGDRVMQTRNDYTRGVFNGDIGVVARVDNRERAAVVDMDGMRVSYEGKELGALQLAYAVSIHKSQGSEFPAVVVPILSEHHVMLRRNLLYTAITRARKLCVLVGDPRAIERAVRRGDAARRYTGLAQRLHLALRGEPDWIPEPDPP